MDNDSSGGAKKAGIAITIVVVILGLVGAWYFLMYKPEQVAKEKAKQEQIAKKAAAAKKKKQQEERAAKKKVDYNNFIEKGDQAFEEENWESAQISYSEASSLFPKEQYPKDQLVLVNEKLDEIAEKSKVGEVEIVSSSTDRCYIIVSSSIDGDLAMDYANIMAAEGNSVKVIEPYANKRFFRVSLSDYDSWEEAESASSSFDQTGEDEVWVLKY